MEQNSKPRTALLTTSPKIREATSFFRSIFFGAIWQLIHHGVGYAFAADRRKRPEFYAAIAPSLTKTYPVCPSLVHRIHIPPSYNTPGHENDKYPLFVLIHGGGWTMGAASMDDEQAHLLAAQHGFLVVSTEYPLARFPKPLHELAAVIQAVLADASLPSDFATTGKFMLGGFSAGAVMSLALAQLPSLQGRIRAVLAVEPLTDWTHDHRGPFRASGWGEPDELARSQPVFDWAYVPAGQDMRDPLLSPLYATRAQIPQPVFLVTGGTDSLCWEGWLLARRLAGLGEGEGETEDVTKPFSHGGVRYWSAKDMPHGFEHFWVAPKDETWKATKAAVTTEMWTEITTWLREV